VSVREPKAVLITGVFGSGKTSVAEEIADVLEGRSLSYALMDLDYLMWFHAGHVDEVTADRMLLSNVASVVGNYLALDVRLFILAGAILDSEQLEGLRTQLSMPLKVVRLTVPLAEIERRLRSNCHLGKGSS
jgi:adenylylsulfate kinase-like enzyme